MDYERFPMIALAYEMGRLKGIMPCVFNASNEISVDLFLKGKIKFLEIENIINEIVNEYKKVNNRFSENDLSIDLLLQIDKEVKEKIINKYI